MKILSTNLLALGLALSTTVAPSIPTVQAQPLRYEKQSRDSIAGVWNSSEGTITFRQSGSNISGNYTQDNGAIEGRISDNVLTGYWSENSSLHRCSNARNGRYYWGKIYFVFNGSSFRGVWGYCGDNPTIIWTGVQKG